MRKKITALLIISVTFSLSLHANEGCCNCHNPYPNVSTNDGSNNSTKKYNNEIYNYKESQRLGKTSQESSSTAVNLSMLGWGVGFAAGIAILSAIVHQSKSSTTTNQ